MPTTRFSQVSSNWICWSSQRSSQAGSGSRDCTVSLGKSGLFTWRLVGCSGLPARCGLAISTPILANARLASVPKRSIARS